MSRSIAKRAVSNLLSGQMARGEERFIYAMIAQDADWKMAWLDSVSEVDEVDYEERETECVSMVCSAPTSDFSI